MIPEIIRVIAEILAITVLLAISHLLQRRYIKHEGLLNRVFTDTSLQRLNGTVAAIIHSWPGPAWIKMAFSEDGNTVFRMLELNAACEEKFGVARLDCIGKTDSEVGYSSERAERYRRHDLMVWASGESAVVKGSDGQVFVKLCLVSPDGRVKGIMGLCMDFVQSGLRIQEV